MLTLILPPMDEVKDIVLDMMPTIEPDADPFTIAQSVEIAECLVALLGRVDNNRIAQAVLQGMLRGIVVRPNGIPLA